MPSPLAKEKQRQNIASIPSPRSIVADALARNPPTLPPLPSPEEKRNLNNKSILSPTDPFFSPRFRFDEADSDSANSKTSPPKSWSKGKRVRIASITKVNEPEPDETHDDGRPNDESKATRRESQPRYPAPTLVAETHTSEPPNHFESSTLDDVVAVEAPNNTVSVATNELDPIPADPAREVQLSDALLSETTAEDGVSRGAGDPDSCEPTTSSADVRSNVVEGSAGATASVPLSNPVVTADTHTAGEILSDEVNTPVLQELPTLADCASPSQHLDIEAEHLAKSEETTAHGDQSIDGAVLTSPSEATACGDGTGGPQILVRQTEAGASFSEGPAMTCEGDGNLAASLEAVQGDPVDGAIHNDVAQNMTDHNDLEEVTAPTNATDEGYNPPTTAKQDISSSTNSPIDPPQQDPMINAVAHEDPLIIPPSVERDDVAVAETPSLDYIPIDEHEPNNSSSLAEPSSMYVDNADAAIEATDKGVVDESTAHFESENVASDARETFAADGAFSNEANEYEVTAMSEYHMYHEEPAFNDQQTLDDTQLQSVAPPEDLEPGNDEHYDGDLITQNYEHTGVGGASQVDNSVGSVAEGNVEEYNGQLNTFEGQYQDSIEVGEFQQPEQDRLPAEYPAGYDQGEFNEDMYNLSGTEFAYPYEYDSQGIEYYGHEMQPSEAQPGSTLGDEPPMDYAPDSGDFNAPPTDDDELARHPPVDGGDSLGDDGVNAPPTVSEVDTEQ